MKLIVEAGSTKTDSVLMDNSGSYDQINKSPGINPVTDPTYLEAIVSLFSLYTDQTIDSVNFYGSGCINDEVCQRVANKIGSIGHVNGPIEVKDDLIAVGRGLCGVDQGIVVILGTGSNIGYYNGEHIADSIISGGYLIGDEGSGYQIGQSIFRRFSRNILSKKDVQLIKSSFSIKQSDSIITLYKNQNPRRFLASFASIFFDLETKTQTEIINDVFNPLVQRMIYPMYKKYKVPVRCSGSIAYHFAKALRQKFEEYHILAPSFEKSPLSGLIKYHLDE